MPPEPGAAHRLLVTGLRGFVGRALTNGVGRRADAGQIALIPLVGPNGEAIDIRDADAVTEAVARVQPTAVIHLAAIASPREAAADPAVAWQVNVMGTFNLAEAVLRHAPRATFVFTGSAEAYGASFTATAEPIVEDARFDPLSPYGATKAAADIMLGQMARQGLLGVRFRPFNQTGAGQAPAYVVASFARQIARIESGQQAPVITVGNLDAARDFLDVADTADAYLAGALQPGDDAIGAFNLSTGRPVAIRALLDQLLALSSVEIRVQQDPALMRSSEVPVVSGNPGRAARTFGWKPRIALATTLQTVLDDWRARVARHPDA